MLNTLLNGFMTFFRPQTALDSVASLPQQGLEPVSPQSSLFRITPPALSAHSNIKVEAIDLEKIQQRLLNLLEETTRLLMHDISNPERNAAYESLRQRLFAEVHSIIVTEKKLPALIDLVYKLSQQKDTLNERALQKLMGIIRSKKLEPLWLDILSAKTKVHPFDKKSFALREHSVAESVQETQRAKLPNARHPFEIIAGLYSHQQAYPLEQLLCCLRRIIYATQQNNFNDVMRFLGHAMKLKEQSTVSQLLSKAEDSEHLTLSQMSFQAQNGYCSRQFLESLSLHCDYLSEKLEPECAKLLARGEFFRDFSCSERTFALEEETIYQARHKNVKLEGDFIKRQLFRCQRAQDTHWAPGFLLSFITYNNLEKYFRQRFQYLKTSTQSTNPYAFNRSPSCAHAARQDDKVLHLPRETLVEHLGDENSQALLHQANLCLQMKFAMLETAIILEPLCPNLVHNAYFGKDFHFTSFDISLSQQDSTKIKTVGDLKEFYLTQLANNSERRNIALQGISQGRKQAESILGAAPELFEAPAEQSIGAAPELFEMPAEQSRGTAPGI